MSTTKQNTFNLFKKSLSLEFNDKTKLDNFPKNELPRSQWPEVWKKIYYKAYPRLDQVVLPKPSYRKLDLLISLQKRKSNRDFTGKPISKRDLSDLLYYSTGISESKNMRRHYPSAGARYPLEIYPFVFNVEEINSAIYHYHVKTHSLELILKKPFLKKIMDQFNQKWIKKSAMLIIVTAIFERTTTKYGDRVYRHILTEYGHIAQNVYLLSSAFGLGCCSIGGFIDNGLNKLLDIDPVDESVIGVIAVGSE